MSDRLDYLREQIENEDISYGELAELQNLGAEGLIPEGDVVLLEWAGVPEFPEDEDEEPTTYANLNAVVKANDEAGRHWFEADTMEFFKSRLETDLIAGRYFITSERGPYGPRAFTIHKADEKAHIHTIGDFMAYKTLKDAKAALEEVRHL